jgi:hypothetical protein
LAGRAGEDASGGFRIAGVEVGHLDLHHFHQLGLGDLADLVAVGLLRTGSEASGFFQEVTRRRTFRHKGERLVLVDRDHDGQHVAALALRGGVELLAERHDVHPGLTQCGSDGR